MPEPLVLLGKSFPITVAPGVDDATVTSTYNVIKSAVKVLNDQQGQLTPTMLQYIGALNGFGISTDRSFTPLTDTADTDLGVYVYFFGAEDIKVNTAADWYAGTIIHDGGHAWLNQQNEPDTGVPVEQALVQVQIDYYNIVGDPNKYIDDLQGYYCHTDKIQARIDEPVVGAEPPVANA